MRILAIVLVTGLILYEVIVFVVTVVRDGVAEGFKWLFADIAGLIPIVIICAVVGGIMRSRRRAQPHDPADEALRPPDGGWSQ